MATNDTQPDVASILQQSDQKISDQVEQITQIGSIGSIDSAIGNSIYGINHRQTPAAIQTNKDHFGLTFFTRPRLNLTTENIRAVRLLTPLLTNDETSWQRIIRCLLSPDLMMDPKYGIRCPLVDSQQAFISILTNHLISMNGWPDVIVPTFTSSSGVYKEEFSIADGVTNNYAVNTITGNFRNLPGDPITMLFFYWAHYQSLVYQGVIVPFPELLINNEVDYNTRIYRLTLDYSRTYVTKIAACGAGFPTSSPIGAAFNYESDRPINASNDQISIPFQTMGAIYQDPILILAFNRTVTRFNDGMKDRNRKNYYQKIPFDALGLFNTRGYPRINPDNYELEWWIEKEEYNRKIPTLSALKTNSAVKG